MLLMHCIPFGHTLYSSLAYDPEFTVVGPDCLNGQQESTKCRASIISIKRQRLLFGVATAWDQ